MRFERWALFDPSGELLLVPSYRTDTESDVWWEWICWNDNGERSHREDHHYTDVEPIIDRMKGEGYQVERVMIERASHNATAICRDGHGRDAAS